MTFILFSHLVGKGQFLMFRKDIRVHQSNSMECFHVKDRRMKEIKMQFF